MILVQCEKCEVLREGIPSGEEILCLYCKTPSHVWHEQIIDPPTEDLALDPDS